MTAAPTRTDLTRKQAEQEHAPQPGAPDNQLASIAQQSGLAPSVTNGIVASFVPFVQEAGRIATAAASIVVTDATQVTEIKESRTRRIEIGRVRVAVEKNRKAQKEEWLRPSQLIDACARHVVSLIEPHETRLLEQEQFAERKEAERKAALKLAREQQLAVYGLDTSFYALGDMDEHQFNALLDGTRFAHQARLDREAKAEADRVAADQARAAEAERMQAENERLKQESEAKDAELKAQEERLRAEQEASLAAERRANEGARLELEAKAKVEREALEAKSRKEKAEADALLAREREAREKVEREAAQARAVEEKRVKDEAAAKRRAAKAPDKDKLLALAATVRGIQLPTCKTDDGIAAVREIGFNIENLARVIDAAADRLGE